MKTIEWTTPLNYEQSPITGWTRKHWEEVFFVLIRGIIASASKGAARVYIPGPFTPHGRLADELEGFSRSFIMAGPWLGASKTGSITFEGETLDIAKFYQQGLLTGTDPKHPEYWGDVVSYSQHLVECASLAWSLYLSRTHIWDQYSVNEQKQVANYLYQCTQVKYHPNNWLLFNVITNTVLKKLGMPYEPKQIEANLRTCNQMYLGDGWYQDGKVNQIDYYNLWAFHYYHLMWVFLDGNSQPEIANIHRERMGTLMQNFRYFFAADGSIPCFGRSSIYRFAYLAPIALGLSLNCLGLDVGEVKTMCHASLKFFFEHKILSDRDHLSLGYLHPCAAAVDAYSCGGSPYWAAKAFNIFLLPESDSFWRTPEKPLAIHTQSFSIPIKSAGFLLVGDKATGHVQLINQKSAHTASAFNKKYTNFIYSSVFSYEARPVYQNYNCDNALTFSKDGVRYQQRQQIENLYCEKDFAASKYQLCRPEVEIVRGKRQTLKDKLPKIWNLVVFRRKHHKKRKLAADKTLGLGYTYTLVKDGFTINVHRIETNESLIFKEGGYSLGFDEGKAGVASIEAVEAAFRDGKVSFIRNLYGYTQQFQARPFCEDLHGSNIRYRYSVVPALGFENRDQKVFYLACMVYGKVSHASIEQLMALVTDFRIEQGLVQMSFHDAEKAIMQLGEIKKLDLSLNHKSISGKVVVARVSANGKSYFILDKEGKAESC